MPEFRVTAQQKKAVAERAKGCCEYCRMSRDECNAIALDFCLPVKAKGKLPYN
ncbi:MAG: hypothetical protein KME08_12520 [Aphanothece sp. CMT-3BRIN-NPC111]|nr:hypothetical protein [Aphanothece sp. CMT-3BRIN-NPC111]